MTFTGRSIAVVAPVGPASGSIQVCIDSGVSVGICTTVSEHSASAVEREVVYVSAPVSTTTSHTHHDHQHNEFARRARRPRRARLTLSA